MMLFDRLCSLSSGIEAVPPLPHEITAIQINSIAADMPLDTTASFLVVRTHDRIVAQVMYKLNGDVMSVAGLWVSPSYRSRKTVAALIYGLLRLSIDSDVRHIYFHIEHEKHTAFYMRLGASKIRDGYEVTLS